MPNHVPTIAQLKPGVVQVQEVQNGPLLKYFVSGGFAAIGEDSKLTITALEAALVDDLDADAVKAGLAQYQDAYAKATEDVAKSEAEIGVEVYQAMSYAISDGS
jgi:F-type H+-transporting ATPase subunit delta